METSRHSQETTDRVARAQVARHARMSWGPRVRAARERLGITQEELAAAADVSPGTIKNIEGMKTVPQQAKLDAVLEFLGLTRRHTERWTEDQWRIAELAVALFDQLPVSRQSEAAGRLAELFGDMLANP